MYYNYNPNEYTYVDGYGFVPPPPQVSEQRHIRRYANGLGVCILGYFLLSKTVSLFLANLAQYIFPNIRLYHSNLLAPAFIYQLIDGITSAISLFLPFFLYILVMQMPFRVAVPTRLPRFSFAAPAVLIVLGVSVIGGTLASLFLDVSAFFHIGFFLSSGGVQSQPEGLAMVLYCINSTVLPALVEEFAFRGCIMQSLRRFGDGFALLVSSVLFALVHLNPPQMILSFLVGLTVGYFVLRTGSIWTGILMHFFNNALALTLDYISQYLSEQGNAVLTCLVSAFYLLSALFSVIYLSHCYPDLFSVKQSKTVLPQKIKLAVFFSSLVMIAAIAVILFFSSRYITIF